MRIKHFLVGAVSSCLLALVAQPSLGQVLYSQDFQVDDTANWSVFDGPTDEFANFFFDYTSATSAAAGHVGIPLAPNSDPGETTGRGMFLQANLFDGIFGGFSVSPNGQSFTGDYVLSYDMWQSYQGVTFVPAADPFPAGGGIIRGQSSGGTNLGYGGIMSSGTTVNYPGDVDSVFFGSTTDGDSGSDYRVYSSDRSVSYQLPIDIPADADATYFAGSRNNTASLYADNFGPEAPTAAQSLLYPNTLTAAPENVTDAGVLGYAWRVHTITKIGDIVTWAVDGIDLIQLDTSNFTIPVGGSNILFGSSDINSGVSGNLEAIDLLFTLVDNVKVEVFVAENADFNGDSDVDGADFLAWQRGNGISDGTALLANGDANGDGNVDASDLAAWQGLYGAGALQALSTNAVPEPTSLLLVAMGLVGLTGVRFRSR